MRRPETRASTSPAASSSESSPAVGRTNGLRSSSFRYRQRNQRDLESAMPALNFWGVDHRDIWRTCFCFHVRTVTIFIGVWHLMIYILALSFVAAVFMYEPQHQMDNHHTGYYLPKNNGLLPEHMPTPSPMDSFSKFKSTHPGLRYEESDFNGKNGPFNFVLETKKANSQTVLLIVCNMLITLLMVYGAVRGKPSYLMPFFVLKVFDFCIFCLTMVGHLSYLPNVKELINNIPLLPMKEELIQMDSQLLALITLTIVVATISLKAYIIGVIWNCYKYLMLRNTVIRGVISYRHEDPTSMLAGLQQNLLPDLPDYDTAISDPRYAKKPPFDATTANSTRGTPAPEVPISGTSSMTPVLAPPPPYSEVIHEDNSAEATTSSAHNGTHSDQATGTDSSVVVDVAPISHHDNPTTANVTSPTHVVDHATTGP